MNKFLKVITIVLLVGAGGCREFQNPFDGDRLIARVGKSSLRQMDIEKVFPGGVSGTDSIRWVESYVDRWVRDNLKLQEADRLFGDEAADEALVDNYRNSLKMHHLEQYFISNAPGDSLFTQKDLSDYYNLHKSEFILDRPIVKGRLIAFPSTFRQQRYVQQLLSSNTEDNLNDLQALAEKNGLLFREIDEWTEYTQFLILLPTRRNESYDQLLDNRGVQSMVDGGLKYCFVISEALKPGMTAPYDMVSDMVKWAVATRRKSEIIRANEDSIYNAALAEKKVTINL